MSIIGPTVQKVCLFMCYKSNFVNFKDIIWLQIYFLLSQEYIEPEWKKSSEKNYDDINLKIGP